MPLTGWFSIPHVSAVLVALGLAFQMGAVLRVLHSIGVLSEIRAASRKRWRRLRTWVGRYISAAKPPPQEYFRGAHESIPTRDSWDRFVVKPTDLPPPEDFEQVGERLKDLQKRLNELAAEFFDRTARHQGEVAEARTEAFQRGEELREAMRAEAAKQLRERRAEGVLLVLGGLLQLVGAYC